MFYLNSQQINNQDHIESMGMVISRIYYMGNLIYQRDITGTSGWLYEGTHTVTVGVGVSSVSITGNGAASGFYPTADYSYGQYTWGGGGGIVGLVMPVQTGSLLFSWPSSATSTAQINGEQMPITLAFNRVESGYGYYVTSSGGEVRFSYAYSAGSNTVISGATSHTFTGAATGVTTAPAETTVTKAVDPYVIKNFNVTVPVGGKCRLEW